MAKSMKKVVGCPSCGVLEEFIAYPSITIPTDREMRDKVKPYSSGDAVPAIMKRKWYIPAFIKTKYVSL